MKTPAEVDELKAQWLADPCWDIEDTEGFEEHKAELLAFREQTEAEELERATRRLKRKAMTLGCPGNLSLATQWERMEERIKRLERAVEKLEEEPSHG